MAQGETRMRGRVHCTTATAVAMLLGVVAQAQPRFDLPAQPLGDSIRAVGSQADTNVLFDPPLVADRSAPPLKGEFSTEKALTKLLAGTGIKYEFINEKTIVLASANS